MITKVADWVEKHRFFSIAIIMCIMWLWIMIFFFMKADEVTKDPCGICSQRMGEEVICTTGNYIPINRVYYPNGTIYDDSKDIKVHKEAGISSVFNASLLN